MPASGRPLLALSLAGLLAAACSAEGAGLCVAAASSLGEVLPPVAAAFEAETGVPVQLVFGGSGELAVQARQGAPYDALLLAGLGDTARLLVSQGGWELAEEEVLGNLLILAVPEEGRGGLPAGGAGGGSSLAAAWPALQGRRVALGGAGVPAGDYARSWMAREGVDEAVVRLVPFEHVRAARAALMSGACDAAFLYRSDLGAGWAALAVDADAGGVRYPYLLRPGDAAGAAGARAFLDFLRTRRADFEAAGFRGGGSR